MKLGSVLLERGEFNLYSSRGISNVCCVVIIVVPMIKCLVFSLDENTLRPFFVKMKSKSYFCNEKKLVPSKIEGDEGFDLTLHTHTLTHPPSQIADLEW